MRVAVIDGQGGGIGKVIVDKLRKAFGEEIDIIALGTNSLATAIMLKAGANEGATGENAISYNVNKVDLILGPIAIICANGLLGELTPNMANIIGESSVRKILIPLSKCNIEIAGIENKPLPHYVEDAIEMVKAYGGERYV